MRDAAQQAEGAEKHLGRGFSRMNTDGMAWTFAAPLPLSSEMFCGIRIIRGRLLRNLIKKHELTAQSYKAPPGGPFLKQSLIPHSGTQAHENGCGAHITGRLSRDRQGAVRSLTVAAPFRQRLTLHFRNSPSSRVAGPARMKTGDRRVEPQVARVMTVDQVQSSGDLRLAPTGLDPWIVSSISEQLRDRRADS
jgi:hypothetical protein